jgi:hypothetical protein
MGSAYGPALTAQVNMEKVHLFDAESKKVIR